MRSAYGFFCEYSICIGSYRYRGFFALGVLRCSFQYIRFSQKLTAKIIDQIRLSIEEEPNDARQQHKRKQYDHSGDAV